MMFSSPSPSILFFCSLYFPLVRSLICNEKVYGNPKTDDCKQALLEIPFARQPVDTYQSRYSHVFAEPQFQEPPFYLITNNFRPQAIIQLPKIWKHNSCRIALMSQGISGSPGVVNPLFTATWRNVIDRSAELRSCFTFNPTRGGWTTFQLVTKHPAATLYMYDGGSPFGIQMNSYMSDGTPVVPSSDGVGFGGLGNTTLDSQTLDFIANLTRRLSLGEYKLLDSK